MLMADGVVTLFLHLMMDCSNSRGISLNVLRVDKNLEDAVQEFCQPWVKHTGVTKLQT